MVPTFKFDLSTHNNEKWYAEPYIKPRIFYDVGYEEQDNNPVFDSYKLDMMNQVFNLNRFTGMDRIGTKIFIH